MIYKDLKQIVNTSKGLKWLGYKQLNANTNLPAVQLKPTDKIVNKKYTGFSQDLEFIIWDRVATLNSLSVGGAYEEHRDNHIFYTEVINRIIDIMTSDMYVFQYEIISDIIYSRMNDFQTENKTIGTKVKLKVSNKVNKRCCDVGYFDTTSFINKKIFK